MSDPQTANKALFTPANGADVDSWDVPVNANWEGLDSAFGTTTPLNATGLNGTQALSSTQYIPLGLRVTGTPIGAVTYQVPSGVGGLWTVSNATSGGFAIGFNSAAGGSTITCPAGQNTIITCDGTSRGMVLAITTTGAAAGSNTQVQFNSSGTLGASAGLTWDGTSLTTTGLNVAGNAVLGSGAGSALSLTGTAVAIPNNLNINSGSLFVNQTTGQVGIGITSGLTALLTVAGSVKITTGGITFPDSTVQTTAAQPTTPAGSNTQVQYNNSGAFGASSALTFNSGTGTLAATAYTGAWAGTAVPIANGGTGVTALAQSLGTTGYQTLVGGLILQWGSTPNIGSGGTLGVVFPLTFPSAIYGVSITPLGGGNADNNSFPLAESTAGFSLFNGSSAPSPFFWFAIGK